MLPVLSWPRIQEPRLRLGNNSQPELVSLRMHSTAAGWCRMGLESFSPPSSCYSRYANLFCPFLLARNPSASVPARTPPSCPCSSFARLSSLESSSLAPWLRYPSSHPANGSSHHTQVDERVPNDTQRRYQSTNHFFSATLLAFKGLRARSQRYLAETLLRRE